MILRLTAFRILTSSATIFETVGEFGSRRRLPRWEKPLSETCVMCLAWCPWLLTAQAYRTVDQHQQSRPFSKLPARLRFSSARANTRWSSVNMRLSQLYFSDLNGSLSEAKKLCFVWPSTWQRHKWSMAAGKQGHKVLELDRDCAAVHVNARPWITPN